ncbi:unnamed protein product [Arctia plantaginis]|uniref:Major facilitator superfamily (MFS) profile domain-containing protein n=1 Tax=Arctia plantaginis TaxID=874455 RepID=A0A8S1BE29_ARCPL|nr:unnamed protein product [Arctia plantaginis]
MLIEKDKVSYIYIILNELVLTTSSEMTVINKPPKDLNGETEELNKNPGQNGDKLEALLSHVGEMGRYQIYLFLATLPFGFTFCFNYFVPILITVTPENYWCRVPELKNLSQELRRNLSAPGASTGVWNQCMTFDTNWTQVLHTLTPPVDGTPLIPCQYGWEFDFSVIPYETVVSERGWVCEQETYPRIAMLLSFVGSVVGCCLFGWIADRYGRIPALIGANLISGIGGIASIFTSGVWDFHVCRFLVGMSFDSCYMIIYVLVLEYVGPQYRTLVANLSYALSFGVAAILVPWAAYFIADWRNLVWVTTLPGFLVLLTPWLLPESAKWLISKGRVNEAVMILKTVESVNRTKMPDQAIEEFMASCHEFQPEKKYLIAKVFKSKPLCQVLVALALLNFGYAIIFDGLLRVTDSYGMNLFTILTAAGVCEFWAVTLIAFTLDRAYERDSFDYWTFLHEFLLDIYHSMGYRNTANSPSSNRIIDIAHERICCYFHDTFYFIFGTRMDDFALVDISHSGFHNGHNQSDIAGDQRFGVAADCNGQPESHTE